MLTAVIPSDNKTPGAYIRVSLGVGARSSGDAPRKVAIFGNKIAAGTAVAGSAYDVNSEDDARTLFGAGSELFLMSRAALKANPGVTLVAVVVAESAGTAGSGTIAVTGPATGAGTAKIYIAGEVIEVPIASGDANTAIASAIEAAIDDQTDWPVTAAVVTSTVTVTSKNLGPRANAIGFRATVDAPGVGFTVSGSGYLASGATSDDPQTVLDATAGTRYHYLVPAHFDATNLAKFKARADANEEPEIGLLEQVVAASYDNPGNTNTVATGINFPRVQVGWIEGSEQTPAVIAAALAAVRARIEGIDPAANLDKLTIPGLKPSPRIADVPLASERKSALNNGVTPIIEIAGGTMVIDRSITTKSLDSSSQPDYRVLDTSKVTVCDAFADDLVTNFADTFQLPGEGFKLAADSSTGDPPGPGVATPTLIRSWAESRHRRYDATAQGSAGQWFENVETNVALIVAEIAPSPAGRILLTVPVDVVEGLHQASIDLRQIA